MNGLPMVVCIALALSSCGIAYQQERTAILTNASTQNFGPPPPANYREVGADLIKRQLKDPLSAQIEWGTTEKDAIQMGFGSPHAVPVWITRVAVNAKNSFGGYTGATEWQLAWKNGQIVAFTTDDAQPLPIWQYL